MWLISLNSRQFSIPERQGSLSIGRWRLTCRVHWLHSSEKSITGILTNPSPINGEEILVLNRETGAVPAGVRSHTVPHKPRGPQPRLDLAECVAALVSSVQVLKAAGVPVSVSNLPLCVLNRSTDYAGE
jgi:hypothetical protein